MTPTRSSRSPLAPALALGALLSSVLPAAAAAQAHDHAGMHPQAQVGDSAVVAATVQAFHAALQRGDTAAVRELLAADVRIAESGGLETRDEYLSHHLPGDMAFAAAVTREPTLSHVTVVDDVAWAVSTSRTTGTFRERAIDSLGAELMVLSRDGERWRIRAVHWSSRQAR